MVEKNRMVLNMNRINGVIIIGVLLVIFGLFGSWYSFNKCDREVSECYSISMSPFIFTVKISDYENTNLDIIDQQIYYLRNINEVSIGVLCVIGSFLSFYSIMKNRKKLALYGGCIATMSILSFSLVLPMGASGFPRMSIGWGMYVAMLGAMLMIVSSLIDFISSRPV